MEMQTTHTTVSFENILCATDFSRHSDAALPYALSIARKYGSKVFVAHVISLFPFSTSFPTEAWQALAAQAVREAKKAMASREPQWKGIPHEALIRRGDIWAEVSDIIDEKGIDLLVVGTHGRTGVSKVLMGSVAEKIFRQARCPVLTVGPNVSGEPDSIVDLHTIVYPTDFSAESAAAVPYAISLTQENQARLYLLHVTKSPVNKAAEGALMTRLLDLIPPEAELSCKPKAYVDSGSPAEKILQLGEELAADLVVLGVKRTRSVSTHLPMATAYKVATQAICPVLTVRG